MGAAVIVKLATCIAVYCFLVWLIDLSNRHFISKACRKYMDKHIDRDPLPLKLKRSGGYQPLAHSSKTNPPPRNP